MTKIYNRGPMKDTRRALRQSATWSEKEQWNLLRAGKRGVKFRRQYSVDRFVLDFYAPQLKLAIEIDGISHDSPERELRDRWRQSCVEKYGIRFLRFRDEEVSQNIGIVLDGIDATIAGMTSPPSL